MPNKNERPESKHLANLQRAIHTASPMVLHVLYKAVCEAYAQRLLAQLGYYNRVDAYWVGDDVGGVLAIGDSYFLNLDEIVLLVDNAIGYDEFSEWYNQWVDMDNERKINLRSWIMGARPGMFDN